jgi:Holliday junction resolvasome RuvABC DNA-binding subunit
MISGTAPDKIETRWLHETREHRPSSKLEQATAGAELPNCTSKLDDAIVREETRIALVGMGWKPMIARSAIETAASRVGRDAPLEAWVREALRHCPLRRS